jgi:hypothetical protein
LVNKFNPPKPDWYQKFYAWVLSSFTKSYEAEAYSAFFSSILYLIVLDLEIAEPYNLVFEINGILK